MTDKVREEILKRLTEGKSLSAICKDEGMPDRSTVQRWQNDDAEFDAAVTHAREAGYLARADKAVEDAKAKEAAENPQAARLAFDAERWYLGKLSNAFSDNKAQKHEVSLDMSDEARRWLGQTS
ncbi:MAG TPA: hypothetical protein VLA99_05995 [Nitrospiraceae bacterium]|nr:hypothetical protein [Nitrospiraceae bacterium]